MGKGKRKSKKSAGMTSHLTGDVTFGKGSKPKRTSTKLTGKATFGTSKGEKEMLAKPRKRI